MVREHKRTLRKKKIPHTAIYKIYRIGSHADANTINPLCNHQLSAGSVITRCDLDDGKMHIVEACVSCERILAFNTDALKVTAQINDIQPQAMYEGPEGYILVWDRKRESILQLYYDGLSMDEIQRKSFAVLEKDTGSDTSEHVQSMCYATHLDILVVHSLLLRAESSARSVLRGIHFTAGDVSWQYDPKNLNPQYVCYHPKGYVFVANEDNLLVIDTNDGSLFTSIMGSEDFENVSQIVSSNYGDESFLAVKCLHRNTPRVIAFIASFRRDTELRLEPDLTADNLSVTSCDEQDETSTNILPRISTRLCSS